MTTRIIPSFNLYTPTTIKEARVLVDKYRGRAKVLAGGTDLLVAMKKGLLSPQFVIKITRIKELRFIKYDKMKGLSLGPLTNIAEIEKSKTIGRKYELLADAAKSFGTVQIQNMATIGGNICNASPGGDMIIALLAMNAKLVLMGSKGKRTVWLKEFLLAPGKSLMKTNEILVEIRAELLPEKSASRFIKIGRSAESLSKVSVGVIVCLEKNKFKDVRVSLGAVAPTPVRAFEVEEYLKGKEATNSVIDEAATLISKEIRPITDIRSTAAYRGKVTRVYVKRAIMEALERGRNK